jgi:hypothetical protein
MNNMDPVVTQVGISVAIVHLIEWLKGKRWFPWITNQSAAINRAVSFSAALLTGIGFSCVTVGSLHSGGSFTVNFPALTAVTFSAAIARMMFGGGVQQWYYTQAVKPAAKP